MTLAKDFEDFLRLLNTHMVEYIVVGGYALAFHGNPRYTGDLDIWINVTSKNARSMMKVLKEFVMQSLGLEEADFLRKHILMKLKSFMQNTEERRYSLAVLYRLSARLYHLWPG